MWFRTKRAKFRMAEIHVVQFEQLKFGHDLAKYHWTFVLMAGIAAKKGDCKLRVGTKFVGELALGVELVVVGGIAALSPRGNELPQTVKKYPEAAANGQAD
jgi:hypothetical protein